MNHVTDLLAPFADRPGVLGVGADIVDVPSFAAQLAQPGTSFAGVFTARERRQAANQPDSLAARWAVKEAFIKAFSQAIFGQPPVIPPDAVVWREIEVVLDAYRRPSLQLHASMADAVTRTLGEVACLPSLSHDGDSALGVVVLVQAAEISDRS